MELTRDDGVEVDIELLRPIDWIESLGLEVGSVFTINLPHTEAVGVATVTALEGCPMLPDGDGQLVIGRFETRNARQLVRVTLSDGSEITGTPVHPVWSEDRQDWVELGQLRIDETLTGLNGPIFVEGITLFTTSQPVYNLEIFGEHVYRFGNKGVLVHNSDPQCEFVLKYEIPNEWKHPLPVMDASGKRIPGNWLSTKDWVASQANEILKKWKTSGVGTGARSGQHGVPYNSAARELREMAKDSNLLDDVREELVRKAKEFEQRARGISHKM